MWRVSARAGTSYHGAELHCNRSLQSEVYASVTDVVTVQPRGDEDALLRAVAEQPVSVAICASSPSFMQYEGGIYQDAACCPDSAHAVREPRRDAHMRMRTCA